MVNFIAHDQFSDLLFQTNPINRNVKTASFVAEVFTRRDPPYTIAFKIANTFMIHVEVQRVISDGNRE